MYQILYSVYITSIDGRRYEIRL